MKLSFSIHSVLFVFVILLLVVSVIDILFDYIYLNNSLHIIIEVIFVLLILLFNIKIFTKVKKKENNFDSLSIKHRKVNKSYKSLKLETIFLRKRLRKVFEKQFKLWNLSPAEIDVCFLIVRGFSFDQISNLLKKSERTVRTQAVSIYEKTGFRNRAELSGFFIETIFDLGDEYSFFGL